MKDIKEVPLKEIYDIASKPRRCPNWCACDKCVENEINQKPPSAPKNHPAWCRCGDCGGFSRSYH